MINANILVKDDDKAQGSSQPVKGGMGVNGLISFDFQTISLDLYQVLSVCRHWLNFRE